MVRDPLIIGNKSEAQQRTRQRHTVRPRMPAVTQSHFKPCLPCPSQGSDWHPSGLQHLTRSRYHTLNMSTCSQATGMGFKSDTMTLMLQLRLNPAPARPLQSMYPATFKLDRELL